MIHHLYEEDLDQVIHDAQRRLKYAIAEETNVSGMPIFKPLKSALRIGMRWDIKAQLIEILKKS